MLSIGLKPLGANSQKINRARAVKPRLRQSFVALAGVEKPYNRSGKLLMPNWLAID